MFTQINLQLESRTTEKRNTHEHDAKRQFHFCIYARTFIHIN